MWTFTAGAKPWEIFQKRTYKRQLLFRQSCCITFKIDWILAEDADNLLVASIMARVFRGGTVKCSAIWKMETTREN